MHPRIYVYKVTFEEIPDWYWGSHKEKKYGEVYLGSPKTHKWKWEFYTPHLQVCELFPYTEEGWTQARKIEDSCIFPDLNNPLCLNEHVGGFVSLEASRKGAKRLHDEKDEFGRSLHTMRVFEQVHKEKDELGRSLTAMKCHKKRDELGRSVHAMKIHEEKDELGRSVHGLRYAERLHREKDENGMSLFAVEKCGKPRKAVVVTFLDGSRQYFNSLKEAGRFFNVDGKSIARRIGKEHPSYKSKLSAYKFEFA